MKQIFTLIIIGFNTQIMSSAQLSGTLETPIALQNQINSKESALQFLHDVQKVSKRSLPKLALMTGLPCAFSQTRFFQHPIVKWSTTILLGGFPLYVGQYDRGAGLWAAAWACPPLVSLHAGHKKIPGTPFNVWCLAATACVAVNLIAPVALEREHHSIFQFISDATPGQLGQFASDPLIMQMQSILSVIQSKK